MDEVALRQVFRLVPLFSGDRVSVVGIATRCVLDGPGIEFLWG